MPSTRSHLADTLKPFKNEALIRLRSSLVGLVVLVLATALFPVPSLWSAARIVRGPFPWDWSLAWAISAVELVVAALLALNFIQAACALRYPRTPLSPPPASPARSLGLATPQPKQRRPIVAHSVSPRSQRSPSTYPTSPVSTPSRVVQYSLSASMGSSTTSLPPTPSPAISLGAYHARHATASGHAFDGLALSRLTWEEEED